MEETVHRAAACSAATLLAACAALPTAPPPIARAPLQDAASILATVHAPRPPQPVLQLRSLPPSRLVPARAEAQRSAASDRPDAPPDLPVQQTAGMGAGAGAGAGAGQAPVRAPAPTAAADDAAMPEAQVRAALEAWRSAWEAGALVPYLAAYAPGFSGEAGSRAAWEAQRRARLRNGGIAVRLEGVAMDATAPGVVDVRFVQHYRSGHHHDVGRKVLQWRQTPAGWRIARETWAPLAERGGDAIYAR